jgi:arylsulfatase A-like enzyme
VNWPGVVKGGQTCAEPIIGVDLYPTFCELTGATLPDGQVRDGVSLVPLLKGGKIGSRALYWHFPAYLQSYSNRNNEQRDPLFRSRPCGIIRFGAWKLHEYFEDGGLELYKLTDDPSEADNLARKHPEKAQELLQMLKAWRKEIKAPVPTEKNPEYDAAAEAAALAAARGGKKKRKNR